jgi:hypothetical protein
MPAGIYVMPGATHGVRSGGDAMPGGMDAMPDADTYVLPGGFH